MKIHTDCLPCLIKRIIFEADQSTKDELVKKRTIKNACQVLSMLYDPNTCSASIATKVHRIAYDTLADDDPYQKLKQQSNKIALSLLPKVKKLVKNSKDPLKTSMICSIIGNIMDFGIEGATNDPKTILSVFEEYLKEGLGLHDTDKVKNILKKSKKVVLFTDNCGEIVFDKILCEQLKKAYPDIFLTLVVKGEAILSDATMQDAIKLGFEDVVDEILTTGCFAVGVDFSNLPRAVEKTIKDSDLIICKGMANYEAFSETDYKPIVYLMRTKCAPIADSMKIPVNISAVKLYG